MPQLPFDFTAAPSYADEDFLVAASNAAAHGWIQRWPDWPGRGLAIFGPPGCGKTHLGQIWRRRAVAAQAAGTELARAEPPAILGAATALLIDDLAPAKLSSAAEQCLFHLHNLLTERRGQLVICAEEAPARWPIDSQICGRGSTRCRRSPSNNPMTACCACCWRNYSPTASLRWMPT